MFNCPECARQHQARVRVCLWVWWLSSAQVGPVNIFLTFRKFREVFSISLPTWAPSVWGFPYLTGSFGT